MGTAVLRPQDCLRDAFAPHDGPLLKQPPTSNRSSRHNRAQSTNRRNRSPNSTDASSSSLSPRTRLNNFAMGGQIRILKRGEEINNKEIPTKPAAKIHRKKKADVTESHPGPPKDAELKGSMVGFYAGSAFFTSPPPSSVPVPVFLKKSVDEEATSDLCRLLNLTL
ncbi:hypothetical protein LINGRAHAP2_LOCUS15773 [Linum grandiflorum]